MLELFIISVLIITLIVSCSNFSVRSFSNTFFRVCGQTGRGDLDKIKATPYPLISGRLAICGSNNISLVSSFLQVFDDFHKEAGRIETRGNSEEHIHQIKGGLWSGTLPLSAYTAYWTIADTSSLTGMPVKSTDLGTFAVTPGSVPAMVRLSGNFCSFERANYPAKTSIYSIRSYMPFSKRLFAPRHSPNILLSSCFKLLLKHPFKRIPALAGSP